MQRELQPALPPSPTLAFPLIATTASGPPAGQSSSSAAAASRPTEYPVSDPPTPEESDSEVTDYDSLPPVPVYDHDTGVRHHDHDTESEKKKKKKNN